MKCRHCQSPLSLSLIDLGSAPPSNAYLTDITLKSPEKYYPLRVMVCENCWLVQTDEFVGAKKLFQDDYPYFSSYSQGWLEHAERYVANMTLWLGLDFSSHVIEIAANDGYLLQYFLPRGIPCLGIEPSAGPAAAARAKGVPIMKGFFGVGMANFLVANNKKADLIVANNVLAHVPDVNDFVKGVSILLNPNGVATFEFPHLLRLVEGNQFDTIYHEHFSYFSLTAVNNIFTANGLMIFDVEEHPTHGGSLRVFAHRSDGRARIVGHVDDLLDRERWAGITSANYYSRFQSKADRIKNSILEFLIYAKNNHQSVAGYGAAAKGNTLLNYAGVRPDLLPFVADITPTKQGKFLPGSRIPVVGEERIKEIKPNYVVILPWNWKEEVVERLAYIREWG